MIDCLTDTSIFLKKLVLLVLMAVWCSTSFGQSTYTVTSTADTPDADLSDNVCADENGDCTLRAAIQNANKTPQKDIIAFNIPGQGPFYIRPEGIYNNIIQPLIIDGTTQPGWSEGKPVVVIDGSNVPIRQVGLRIMNNASGCIIRGLVMGGYRIGEDGYGGFAITIDTNDNIIEGNYFGIDADGETALPNARGVQIMNASNNLVGGEGIDKRNLFSGNRAIGLAIFGNQEEPGPNSYDNRVVNNYFGTNASGTTAVPNNNNIQVSQSAERTVIQGNLISGASFRGIVLASGETSGTRITGNLIGTDHTGTQAIPNSTFGINLLSGANNTTIGGLQPEDRNIISGNGSYGIGFQVGPSIPGNLAVKENQVFGNYIGLDINGKPLPNGNGILIVGLSEENTIGGIIPNVISGNTNNGIVVSGENAFNNTIKGNLIGVDADGENAIPNGSGIFIQNSQNNTIGGTFPEETNIISGNRSHGLVINGGGDNQIEGNYIGLNQSGDSPIGNGQSGIYIFNSTDNIVGGGWGSVGNTISGNTGAGITIAGEGSMNNTILGNRIGTDTEGIFSISNDFGISISNASTNSIGGANQGEGNLISGNNNTGIRISGEAANENVIIGNKIGTDLEGVSAIPNGINETSGQNLGSGILISNSSSNKIGGVTAASRNLISGNVREAIAIAGIGGDNNVIQGNFLGTDINGTSAIGNQRGVMISNNAEGNIVGGYNESERNIISGNTIHGITLGTGASQNKILGNFIGTDVTGTLAVGNEASGIFLAGVSDNLIGDAREGAKNIVSGNGSDGIWVSNATGATNAIHGNYIGTDVSGTIAIGNRVGFYISGGNGTTVGGTNQGESNLISGNNLYGMLILNSSINRIVGNYVGTSPGGIDPLPNSQHGVLILGESHDNTIGGLNPGEANTIAHNGRSGVLITRGTQGNVDPIRNKVSGNRIFSNQLSGIGLDTPGITPNDPGDADTGPNQLQNFPEITDDLTVDGSQVSLRYFVPSSPDNSAYPIQVEFFIDDGNRQGKTLVVVDQFTETDYSNGPFKTLDFSLPSTITLQQGDNILATATDANGNTSEFGGIAAEFDLSLTIQGEGLVASDPDQTLHYGGSEVTLTASPATGWEFDRWEGNLTGSSNPATLTMEGDRAITAVFVAIEYPLSIDVEGNGQVSKDPEETDYAHGTVVSLTANPEEGWEFLRWEGDLVEHDNPAMILIDEDKAVTAVFVRSLEIEMSVVHATCPGSGDGSIAITPTGGTAPYQFDWGALGSTESGAMANLAAGTYPVTVTDANGLTLALEAEVLDTDTSVPVPDLAELPVIRENVIVRALTAPTATHACEGSIIGTSDVTFPIRASTTVTWTYTDSSGNNVTQEQQVVVEVDEITLYPNPVLEEGFWIAFPPSSIGIRYNATLYSAGGSLIAERDLEIGEGSNSIRWDIDHVDWSNGAYLLVLRSSAGVEAIKLLKQPK